MFLKNYPRLPMLSLKLGKWFYSIPFLYRKLFYQKERFTFKQKSFECFWHPYNPTWRNERAVEIPIAKEMLKKYPATEVLEVGNVLSHYFPVQHMILDKYEQGRNVVNKDVVDFSSEKPFQLIVAISTIEHIGWDESPREKGKHRKAINHLRSLLAPGGVLFVTAPIGQNHDLDADLAAGNLNFDEYYFYKRLSKEKWGESTHEEVKNTQYNTPYRAANAFWIGIARNPKKEKQTVPANEKSS